MRLCIRPGMLSPNWLRLSLLTGVGHCAVATCEFSVWPRMPRAIVPAPPAASLSCTVGVIQALACCLMFGPISPLL